jgi:hypothetical protein
MRSLCLLACLSIAATPAFSTPLLLSFGQTAVTVSNVSSGATVYGFSESLEALGWSNGQVSREALLSESNGAVVWDIATSIPLRSVWFAANMSTGDFGVAPAPGYPVRRVNFTGANLIPDKSGSVKWIRYQGYQIWFVVVRPHVGSWRLMAFDGGADDADGVQDGHITVDVAHFLPALGTTQPPPKTLDRGDVVFAYCEFYQMFSAASVGSVTTIPALSERALLCLVAAILMVGLVKIRPA